MKDNPGPPVATLSMSRPVLSIKKCKAKIVGDDFFNFLRKDHTIFISTATNDIRVDRAILMNFNFYQTNMT